MDMGVINVPQLADSLGISKTSLSTLLYTYVTGYLEQSASIFRTSGAAPGGRQTGTSQEAYYRQEASTDVQVLRGGEFVGNRLRYKVKVLNNSRFVITDITVSLVTYPRDALTVQGTIVKTVAKIDPGGFDSPLFEFMPSKDCVKGEVVAMVCWVDHVGKPHMAMTDSFTVRAVCDLLIPENITPEQFELKLTDFSHGEMSFKVSDWTPEEMHSKALQVLEMSNFSEVTTNQNTIGEHIESRITGWARGKYTKKNLGVELTITGKPGAKGATCTVRMSGEDEAMIMPAIDEMSQNLTAYLCPMCGGELPDEAVSLIRDGKQCKCPFCGVSVCR
jgi:DNA-directed RNA polymerase subunit RPC12/RpoP